jgi:hypothetical protein
MARAHRRGSRELRRDVTRERPDEPRVVDGHRAGVEVATPSLGL